MRFRWYTILASLLILAIGLSANEFEASARSVSMGYTGVTVPSEYGAFYNPAGLSLYYADHPITTFGSLTASLMPGRSPQSRLPGISSGTTEDIGTNSLAFPRPFDYQSAGIGLRLYDQRLENSLTHLTVALAFSSLISKVTINNYSTENYLDDFYLSREPLYWYPLDNSRNDYLHMLSISAALRGNYNASVGVTVKEADGVTLDVGLLVSRSFNMDGSGAVDKYVITPAVGVTAFNLVGDAMLEESNYELIRRINAGASCHWAMIRDATTVMTFLMTAEYHDNQNDLRNIYPVTSRPDTQQNSSGTIFGGTEYDRNPYLPDSHLYFGWEAGLGEALFLRIGLYNEQRINHGIGLRPLGLARFLGVRKGLIGGLAERIDISYDFASIDKSVPSSGNRHQLSLSLR